MMQENFLRESFDSFVTLHAAVVLQVAGTTRSTHSKYAHSNKEGTLSEFSIAYSNVKEQKCNNWVHPIVFGRTTIFLYYLS